MGLKNRLEGKLTRALKEGRTEDAERLRELLTDLTRARGDAAYARAQGARDYEVQAGDTPERIAEEVFGDPRWRT